MNQLAIITTDRAPALITAAGERAAYRFIEFFTTLPAAIPAKHGATS